jgi:hypothetical protein
MKRALAIGCLMLVLASGTVSADCIDQAIPELTPGTPMTILKTDGSRVRATLVRVESPRWILNASPVYARRTPRKLELTSSEIGRIDVPGPTRLNVKRFGLSVLSGLVLGVAVASLVPEPHYSPIAWATEPDASQLPGLRNGDRHVILGGAVGAAVGTLGGLVIGHDRGKARSWSCMDPAPAAADSLH